MVALYAAFIGPSLVIEKRRLSGAIQRSIDLGSTDTMRVLGLVALMSFVSWVLSVGLGGVVDLGYGLIPHGGQS